MPTRREGWNSCTPEPAECRDVEGEVHVDPGQFATTVEAECRTPRQIQLANAFCRYLEMAEHLDT
jgi:hypothetical protein